MILLNLGRTARLCCLMAAGLVSLNACGPSGLFGGAGRSSASGTSQISEQNPRSELTRETRDDAEARSKGLLLGNLLGGSADPNTTLEVNKYLWAASLDVLNFLPIEQIDPFTGVIVTGYGTPPGSGRSYRATIYVQDPALDARSLKVALQSRGGGAVAPETVRAVEDAILSRARQLRIQDSRL